MTADLSLSSLERMYACFCRSGGLACQTGGGIRWYDWLSADQVLRIFLCDEGADLRRELFPSLLRHPRPVSVLAAEPTPPGLADCLADAGLAPSLRACGMQLAEAPVPPALPAGYELAACACERDFQDHARLVGTFLTGHRRQESIEAFSHLFQAVPAARLVCLSVRDASGRTMASASGFLDLEQSCMGIYHVVTHPERRRQGLAAALVANLAAQAFRRGLGRVVLQTAMPNARRIYERIGFRATVDYQRWTRKDERP